MKTQTASILHFEPRSVPTSHEDFYRELCSRNRHFIAPEVQSRLKDLRILIAGCGSTGGACIEALARAGAEDFTLCDNGAYDLSNLNRQHARLDRLGQNKAEFHADELLAINPFIRVKCHNEGVTPQNLESIVSSAELIMDAVDVTTPDGIARKLDLHEMAHKHRKPVFTALDIGFRQWGKSYDYRNSAIEALDGKIPQARQAQHPLKALFTFVPLSVVPAHSLGLLYDLMKNPGISASQLGCTSDLLSAFIVPAAIRFASTGQLIAGWNYDMSPLAHPFSQRLRTWAQGLRLRREVKRMIQASR